MAIAEVATGESSVVIGPGRVPTLPGLSISTILQSTVISKQNKWSVEQIHRPFILQFEDDPCLPVEP